MNEQIATTQFYKWEQKKYGDNTPLSDYDREIWVAGYLQAMDNFYKAAFGDKK